MKKYYVHVYALILLLTCSLLAHASMSGEELAGVFSSRTTFTLP